jgi:hypothetical protein
MSQTGLFLSLISLYISKEREREKERDNWGRRRGGEEQVELAPEIWVSSDIISFFCGGKEVILPI